MGVRDREELRRRESAVMYANKRILVDDDEVQKKSAELQKQKASQSAASVQKSVPSLNIQRRTPENTVKPLAERMDYTYYKMTGNVLPQTKTAAELQDEVNSFVRNSNSNAMVAQKYYSNPSAYNDKTMYGIQQFYNSKAYSDFQYKQLKANLLKNSKENGETWTQRALKAIEESQKLQNNINEYIKQGEKAYYIEGYYKKNPDKRMSDEELKEKINVLLNEPIDFEDRLMYGATSLLNKTNSFLGKFDGNNGVFDRLAANPIRTPATDRIELEKAIKADVDSYRHNIDAQKYAKYVNNPDFEEKSKEIDENERLMHLKRNEDKNSVFSQITFPMKQVERAYQKRHLTDDEEKIYNYIYNTQGFDAAEEYYKHIESGLNLKATQEAADWTEDYTLKHPYKANIASFGTNLMSGMGYVDDTVNILQGENLDTNNLYHLPANLTSAIRSSTQENLIDTEAGKFLYNTGMSIGDFALAAALSGAMGTPQVAPVLLSSSSATNTVIDAKNRGLSDSQAYTLGTISGAAEYVSEKISIDRLFDTLISGKATASEIVKQMVAEGSEEVFSSSVNLIADIVVAKDKSQWELAIAEYEMQGMSREEAIKQAIKDEAGNLALDFAGGAISGGVMGGGAVGYNSAVNNAYNRKIGDQIINNNQSEDLNSIAARLNRDSKAYNLSYRYGIDNKSKTGKLYNEAVIQADSEIKDNAYEIIAQRLAELGEETSTVPDVAEAVRKVMYQEELSERESMMLYVSPNARKVMGEFRAALSGEQSAIRHESIDRRNQLSSLMTSRKLDSTVTVNSTGERSEITGVKSVDENDVVTYNLKNGGTATSEDITFENEITERVANSVQRYGIAGADAFIKMYNGEDAEVYTRAFDTMFKHGANDPDGKLENDVMNSASAKILNLAQNKAAYLAGRAYAQSLSADTQQELSVSEARVEAVTNIAQRAPHKTIGNVNVANIRTKSLTPKQNASIKVMSEISKVTGGTLKMVAFESKANLDGRIEESNGWYDAKTNTLYFDINAGVDNIYKQGELDRAILRTGSHELTHFVQNMSPEYYAGLKGFIVDSLNSADPNRTEQLISAKMKALPKLSYDEALDEVIADSCEMLLRDSNTIKKLARENMTLAQKIKAWIDDFVKNIRKAFEGVSAKSQEAVLLEQALGDMTELQNMWDEALEDALRKSKEKGTANGTQTENTVDNGKSEVYSKRSETENKYKKKKTPYDEFNSNVMQWSNSAVTQEGDTKVFCKKAGEFVLLEADGNGGAVELARGNYRKVAELYDEIEEEVNRIRKDIRSNSGKNGIEHGRNSRNSVIYEDGLNDGRNNRQTSGTELQSDTSGNNEHNRTGDKGKSVKYSLRDSDANKLSENQIEYFKDSKVRDKDGNLLVMYHGTPHDFTVFKNRGSGMYFTADPEYAYGYTQLSGKVMKVYLNITKPFDILKDNVAKKIFVDEFIKGGYAQGIHPSSSMSEINKYIENGVDWVEGDNLIEFLEENEYDYDGLVINEGSDSVADGTGNKAVWRGFSHVTFNSNQSKNVENLNPTSDPDVRYSKRIADDVDLEKSAVEYFGKTYSWKETGYILLNGSKLDFSGKHNGARGGYRTVDHREIIDSFPEEVQDELDGNEAMVEFMQRGNIRIMPEGSGINLSVLPTDAQEKALADFISRERGEVTLDIDDEYGYTVVSVEYPKGTRSDRILRDIRQYFKDGTEPVVSDVSRFRYSRRGTAEEFLSTENRAKPNSASSINWVYKAEIFSVTENKMFHQKISEINQGSEAFEQNADGEYMLPIENKIVFTDGDYDAPYISKIIEVMTNSGTKFEDAKGVIFDVESGRYGLREAAQPLEILCGKGCIVFYKNNDSTAYGWTDRKRKGKNRRAVIERYQRLQNRRGNDTESRGTESVDNDILFSYRSTQIDGRYLAREIKRDYLSTISIENLQSVIDSLAKAQERINTSDDYEQLYSATRSFAEKILANSNMLDDVNAEKAEELERLKSYFSGMSFKVTPEMRLEIEQDFGDYQTFRNAMFGKKIYFSANAQYTLDSTWSEICENFPELFDEDTNPGDQPRALFDAFNSFYVRKGIDSNVSEYSDMIDSLTNKIIDNLPLQSEAETQEIDTSNFTHRELLRNALSTVAQNDTERDFLARYQREIKDVEKKYEEVAKLRRQIHDISFTKDSDRSQLPAIKNRVAILEDQIQRTDKKLLQLEATKALKDVVEREKKTAVKKANERNKRTFERYKSRKRSSEVREKIKSLHKDLVKSLLYPTDKNYIPPYLVKSMVDVCNAIDFSTDRTGPDGGKTKAQEQREKIKASLNKLKNEYEKLKKDNDPNYRSEYDEAMVEELTQLIDMVSNSRVGDMTETQLQAVYQSLKTIQGTLRDAKKQIGMEEGRSNAEIGLGIIEEQRQIDRKKKGVQKLGQKYSDFVAWNTVSPMRNILRISGYDKNSELYHLAEQLNEGQRKKDIFVMESHKMFEHLIDGKENKKKYQDAIGKAHDFGVVDVDGNAVEMSKMTAMQLVMSWEREMASNGKHSHLQQSGAIIPNHKLLMNGKVSEAVSAEHAQRIDVDATLINDIFEQLDEWDKEYMEVAHKFFDEKSKNALNETSRVVSHRDVALSEKYIPYKVDEDFVFKKEISDENHIRPTLISTGMLKDTVRNAGQPLVMTSLNHVLDTQIEQVGAYYGLAIPVRNFNKVWNFMSDNRISVRESITKNWGKKGMMVIDQTIRDLQADRVSERNKFIDTANSAFVRSVLNSNISVTLKQLSALPSAYSVLNQRFVPGAEYGQFLKMCIPSKFNKTIEEIDRYTASHWLRRQGLSSQELGDIAKSMGPVKRFNDRIPAALNPTKWIQGMDCLVTASFWDMCKKDIRMQGNFKEGSEEFMQAVADLYNRVIEDTQAVYDTLHRPEVLKTTNALTRQLFMFRSESLQHSGILYEKYGAMLTNKNKDTVRDFAKTAYAQYSSAMSFAVLSLVGAALLHKMNPYRDEDEELTPESIIAELLNDLTNVLADLVMPIGGAQLQEFIYGKISGNKYSDGSLSVPAVDFINDFIDSVSTLNNAITAEEADNEKIMTAVEDLTFKFAGLFGIPADNVKNIIKTFKLHIEDAVNGEFGSFEAGVDRSNTVNYHRATEALIEGDMQKYDDVITELTESGTDQDKIQQGIKNQLKDFYLEGRITDKQAIEFLAKYGGDDDENDAYFTVKSWNAKIENADEEGYSWSVYNDLEDAVVSGGNIDLAVNELINHGYEEDKVYSKIKSITKTAYLSGEMTESESSSLLSKYLGKDDSEIYWIFDEWNYYKSNPTAEPGSYKKYNALYEKIDEGGSADIAGEVKRYMDNGVSKKNIGSTLTKQYKDKFIELYYTDKTAAADLKNSLLRAYYAAGYNWNNKSKDINDWLKDS